MSYLSSYNVARQAWYHMNHLFSLTPGARENFTRDMWHYISQKIPISEAFLRASRVAMRIAYDNLSGASFTRQGQEDLAAACVHMGCAYKALGECVLTLTSRAALAQQDFLEGNMYLQSGVSRCRALGLYKPAEAAEEHLVALKCMINACTQACGHFEAF